MRRSSTEECEAVVGYPGLQNVNHVFRNGDVVLIETPQHGIVEVRAIPINSSRVEFLLTQVSPNSGFSAGAFDGDPSNSKFSESELVRIAKSLSNAKIDLQANANLNSEQLDLVLRKLDDIELAADRLGRKDWINYVAGTLTSVCISAAFTPEIAKFIFKSINSAFSWLFANGALLLLRL